MEEFSLKQETVLEPPSELLENNRVLANRYLDILDANMKPYEDALSELYENRDEAYQQYQKAKSKLEKLRTQIINTYYLKEWDEYSWATKEEDLAWKAYQQAEKDSGGNIGYNGAEAQAWSKKNKEKRETSAILETIEQTVKAQFPAEAEDTENKEVLWRQASEEVHSYSSKGSDYAKRHAEYTEAYNKGYEAWEQSYGKKYEGNVNAYLDTIRDYQQKKEDRLNTKLFDGLQSIDNPEMLEKGRALLGKFTEKLNSMAGRARQQVVRHAVWAVSALTLCFALNKANDIKTANYISQSLDNEYEVVKNTPHDSVTNVIFHNIAGDETLPEEWRTFLAHEDSTEFGSAKTRKKFVEGSEPTKPTWKQKLAYINLWKINKRHGNPKAIYGQHAKDHDRASYHDENNTMLLPTYAGQFRLSDYMAELSHAHQWNDDGKKYNKWFAKDVHHTDSVAQARKVSYHDAQFDMYDNPNTVEYEAHSIIEPKLNDEYARLEKQAVENLVKKQNDAGSNIVEIEKKKQEIYTIMSSPKGKE